MSIGALDWSKGLLPAVVQHAASGEVLMVGFMNEEALERTLASGRVTFFSRSRGRLWTKGESSGNFLHLCEVRSDCDGDTLLLRVRPAGPVCHRGTRTCFDQLGAEDPSTPAEASGSSAFLDVLDAVVAERQARPEPGSYTHALLSAGVERAAQKVGEEGVELALAAVGGDRGAVVDEAADLVFHLIVALRARDVGLAEVAERLRQRHESRKRDRS